MSWDWMTWDIQLSLILMGVTGLVLIAWKVIPGLMDWIRRLIWWHRVKPYSACYITYRKNMRVLR